MRWSAEARRAFLAVLGRTGIVKEACRAAGLSVAGAHDVRKRDAEFARAWDEAIGRVKAAWAAARAHDVEVARTGLLRGYRCRRDGWTERRQKMFLLALSQTGCVRDACARAGISNTSAYRMRARSPEFARGWDRALRKAAPTIEHAAYVRAVEGWDEVVIRNGEVYSMRRRYSDSLLRLLLQRGDLSGARARAMDPKAVQQDLAARAREAAQAAGGYFSMPASEEETNRALTRKLAAVRVLMEREDPEAAARVFGAEEQDPDYDDGDGPYVPGQGETIEGEVMRIEDARGPGARLTRL